VIEQSYNDRRNIFVRRKRMSTAKAQNQAATGFGLRQRLVLSFIAISGFAVVAAVVGIYAFYAIGEGLHEVTAKSVPPAIATLELAQRTERIVAAGPALLAATNNAEFASASSTVGEEVNQAVRDDVDLRGAPGAILVPTATTAEPNSHAQFGQRCR
jgi:hypothetical protein